MNYVRVTMRCFVLPCPPSTYFFFSLTVPHPIYRNCTLRKFYWDAVDQINNCSLLPLTNMPQSPIFMNNWHHLKPQLKWILFHEKQWEIPMTDLTDLSISLEMIIITCHYNDIVSYILDILEPAPPLTHLTWVVDCDTSIHHPVTWTLVNLPEQHLNYSVSLLIHEPWWNSAAHVSTLGRWLMGSGCHLRSCERMQLNRGVHTTSQRAHQNLRSSGH